MDMDHGSSYLGNPLGFAVINFYKKEEVLLLKRPLKNDLCIKKLIKMII
jgi:hypothetical protein